MQESFKPFAVTDDVWMVPCLINRSDNDFQPLARPFSEEVNWQKLQTRQAWLPVEDATLRDIIEKQGVRAWSLVARELNKRVHKGIPIRQGKQCRERYYNHIDPRLVKGNWSLDEDLLIMEQQKLIGNRWSKIAKCLPGRTENQVKNRFKSLVKKGSLECPKGLSPIEHLLGKLKTPLDLQSPTITPGTHHSTPDEDFSGWADSFQAFASPAQENTTPSPTSMLFFHQE